jgi:hypothetical protein
MDLICVSCGEPWEMDYVLHDEPNEFKRKGGVITKCPCCPKDGSKPVLDNESKAKLEIIESLGDVLGDDVDGFAAELEDLGLL